MKTITSIALAGIFIAATAASANAGGWDGPGSWKHRGGHHHPHPQFNNYHQAPDEGAALAAGAILGLTFGLLANEAFAEPEPYYQPEPVYEPEPFQHADAGAYLDHVEWCRANYRSYNEETDTFRDFQSVIRRCVAPY